MVAPLAPRGGLRRFRQRGQVLPESFTHLNDNCLKMFKFRTCVSILCVCHKHPPSSFHCSINGNTPPAFAAVSLVDARPVFPPKVDRKLLACPWHGIKKPTPRPPTRRFGVGLMRTASVRVLLRIGDAFVHACLFLEIVLAQFTELGILSQPKVQQSHPMRVCRRHSVPKMPHPHRTQIPGGRSLRSSGARAARTPRTSS